MDEAVRRLKPQTIAAQLRKRILTGEYPPGMRIKLDHTAQQLGVSNTPVREALLRLESEGLVHLQPYRGFIVAPLPSEDLGDALWIQEQIHIKIIDRCVTIIQPSDIDDLQRLNDDEPDQVAYWEERFHHRINRIADSPMLSSLLEHAHRYTPFLEYANSAKWHAIAKPTHDRLIQAFRDRNRSGAIAAIVAEYMPAHKQHL